MWLIRFTPVMFLLVAGCAGHMAQRESQAPLANQIAAHQVVAAVTQPRAAAEAAPQGQELIATWLAVERARRQAETARHQAVEEQAVEEMVQQEVKVVARQWLSQEAAKRPTEAELVRRQESQAITRRWAAQEAARQWAAQAAAQKRMALRDVEQSIEDIRQRIAQVPAVERWAERDQWRTRLESLEQQRQSILQRTEWEQPAPEQHSDTGDAESR